MRNFAKGFIEGLTRYMLTTLAFRSPSIFFPPDCPRAERWASTFFAFGFLFSSPRRSDPDRLRLFRAPALDELLRVLTSAEVVNGGESISFVAAVRRRNSSSGAGP